MFDLAFVGSGLSTSIVLRSFLEDLLERPRGVVIDVCVIEQGPDLFGGVAYGARSGATSRVISPLSEFLNDAERSRFVAWLSETSVQHPEILDDLTGAYTSTWIAENRRAIETGLCDDLFIPRSLFGRYLREAMERIIADATAAGAATIRFIHASVTDIDRTADGFRVATDGPDGQVESERVVLGIGTPSGRRVSETLTPAPGVLVVTDPYALGMQATIDRIAAHLERPGPRPIPPKLVIVGSNATMLDFVYQCEDDQRIAKLEPTYCVVSQSGTLPARYASPSDPVRELPHLEALKHRHDVRACDVVAAIDADRAHYRVRATPTSVKERNGDHDDGGWMIPAISRTIADLAAQLPPNERRIFANRTGAEIGRMQRRAGAEYLGIVDALKEAGRFVGVAASFESVRRRPQSSIAGTSSSMHPDPRRSMLTRPRTACLPSATWSRFAHPSPERPRCRRPTRGLGMSST
ncbi:MAG: FAD/NAD(P)-binding protein [Acidimicrobiales bacterium]